MGWVLRGGGVGEKPDWKMSVGEEIGMLKVEGFGLGVSTTVLVMFTPSRCEEGTNINTYVMSEKQT